MTDPTAIALAGRALRETLRHPGLVAAIYLSRLAVAAGFAFYATRLLGPTLEGRPPPDLLSWILLARTEPAVLVRLAIAAGGFALFYHLAGTLVAGLVLRRLEGGTRTASLGRSLARLALLRLATLLAASVLLAGWGLLAYRAGELGLALDERLQIALQIALGLLVGLPVVSLLISVQLAQPLVVEGHSAWRAARAALALLHRRPAACSVLSLGGWALMLALATCTIGSGIAFEQAAAAGSAAVQLWGYAWALAIAGRAGAPGRE